MYRPPNWDKLVQGSPDWKDRESLETGVDLILETLKRYGVECDNQDLEYLVYPNPKIKGQLIFIPDEEEQE